MNLFSEHLKNISAADKAKLLDQINASASSLPLQDLKTIIQALSAEVKAQEAKTSKKAMRLKRLQAAVESDDPRIDNARRVAETGLRQLGMKKLNDYCEAGIAVSELDAKMKEAKFDINRRSMMKGALLNLGLIEI